MKDIREVSSMDTEPSVLPFQYYARLRAFHYPGSHSDYVFTRKLKYLQGHLILTLVLSVLGICNSPASTVKI